MTIHAHITPDTAAAPPARLAEQHFKTALGILETTHAGAAQGWTPQRQSQFLAAIADGATVADAAQEAGLSRRSAYAFRRTTRGSAFRLGWQAAEILAADSLREDLWDRAKHGQTWTVVREDGERTTTTTRHRFDNRLALSMLTRLEDRLVTNGIASRLANRFGDFLTVLEEGDAPADPAELVATVKLIGTCESCEPDEDDEAEDHPSAHAPVWYEDGDWWTRFPLPADSWVDEEGEVGDPDYRRTLTGEEEEAVLHFHDTPDIDPAEHATACAERDAWFAAAPGFAKARDVVVRNDPLPPGGDDSAGAERGVAQALETTPQRLISRGAYPTPAGSW